MVLCSGDNVDVQACDATQVKKYWSPKAIYIVFCVKI